MIYAYAKQIIAMFFLIAVVNLLVIPASYKKIISFYLHFFIIVIILKPVIRIMNNEVSTFIDSISFISEAQFDESVQYYQGKLEQDLEELTLSELEPSIQQAEQTCRVQIATFVLDEVLTLQMVETSEQAKTCVMNELGLNRDNIRFEEGGQ